MPRCPNSVWMKLWKRQHGESFQGWCDVEGCTETFTIDETSKYCCCHDVSDKHGGPPTEDNMAIRCNHHNTEQGTKTFREYDAEQAGKPLPRPYHADCNPLFLAGKAVQKPLLAWLKGR